jgi:hypothetical protein
MKTVSTRKLIGKAWRGIPRRTRLTLNRLARQVDPEISFVYQLDASGLSRLADIVRDASCRFSMKEQKLVLPKLQRVCYLKSNGHSR